MTHSNTLILDPFNHIQHTINIHSFILIHLRRQPTSPDHKEDQLVNRSFLANIVIRGLLIILHPVLDQRSKGNIGRKKGVYEISLITIIRNGVSLLKKGESVLN
jgi:hypothetical protein